MARDLYRRGSGPWFYLAIVVLAFSFYSLAVAAATADKCEASGTKRSWQVFPPQWECEGRRGLG